jgi:hypothetical protein
MIAMQKDTVDIYAREILPILIRITNKYKESYLKDFEDTLYEIDELLQYFEDWDYDLTAESTPALIYNVWETELIKQLLHKQIVDEEDRLEFHNSLIFDEVFVVQVQKWGEDNLSEYACHK